MGELTLFRAVLTVVVVLLAAYWCSRLMGKKWMRTSGSRNIKVIECIQVGQDRKILLLKIGDSNYLVGVSQAGIQMLTEVEGDFKEEEVFSTGGTAQTSFADVLEKYRKFHQKKKGGDK